MNSYCEELQKTLTNMGHSVVLTGKKSEIRSGDLLVLAGCIELMPPEILKLNQHNIAIHASKLPLGRGWSPAVWQILEGKSYLDISLFEAVDGVDAGDVYLRAQLPLQGTELSDQWQKMLAEKIQEMCLEFISGYDHYLKHAEVQTGEPTYYKKRSPQDSQLDISKSIEEQFNLLRVVDNEKYPAFFVKDGVRYVVKIYQDKN